MEGGGGRRVWEASASVCACVWRAWGNSEEAEGCSPAPERFVSAKRFPCPSQMAGHAPPLAGEKEEQKEHGGSGHTCFCPHDK